MKSVLVGLSLFILQIRLVYLGDYPLFNKYWNPVALLLVSALIPAYLLWQRLRPVQSLETRSKVKLWMRMIWSIGGLLVIGLAYEELRKIWVAFPHPETVSDVIPQLRALYERFASGAFPYAPVHFDTYEAYPVYMPLHWLPIGIPEVLHIDIRWAGFGLYMIVVGLLGWFLAARPEPVFLRIMALLFPSLPLWAFIHFMPLDLAVSFELVVAAYYLVLALGLWMRNNQIILLGIIFCLLSRYTLFFWLPLFAWLFFLEKGWKKSAWMWGGVAFSVVFFFVLPFLVRDPSILHKQLAYYKGATIGDWIGCCGDNPISWTQERGISFAAHMKALFHGDMAHRIWLNQIVLGVIFLLAYASSIWGYRRWRGRIDFYIYTLIALYVFMAIYYFFGPLTYRYYMLPFLSVSAVLCMMIILGRGASHALSKSSASTTRIS